MSSEAPIHSAKAHGGLHPLSALARIGDFEVGEKPLNMIVTIMGALCFSYVFMCVKIIASGQQIYPFGDFFALWTSAVVTHEGHQTLNYDPDLLHARQVAMGMNPHWQNPFPYPPTLLLLLAPLGALSVAVAFWVFMIPSFALYLWSMVGGRLRSPQWWFGATLAPATAVNLISGQSGFLSGALMLGGLRLATKRPIVSGVLFGLLTYKPQLGILVPIALVAAGLWRTIASACATVALGMLISSVVFGWDIWPIWFHSMTHYAREFETVADLMPTIQGNVEMLGAPRSVALLAQAIMTVPIVAIVWMKFTQGVTPAGIALLVVGTFLATPHAFNYDMPMMTAALVWYVDSRYRVTRSLDVAEIIAVLLGALLPFIMLNLKGTGMAFSYAPLLLMFVLIARPDEAHASRARPLAAP